MACSRKNIGIIMPGRSRHGKQNIKIIGSALNNPGIRPDFLVDCGQCIVCRLDRSRIWATRIVHESKQHESACFLTLTYDDLHMPVRQSLDKSRLRTFFNDLRGRLGYAKLPRIKFFAVGEYGEKKGEREWNPHYHAIVFGQDFAGTIQSARKSYKRSDEAYARSGAPQWSHDLIRDVWPDGRHTVAAVSFESAAYVARYALKKVKGRDADSYYDGRQPEFQSTSNGIGKTWFTQWKEDTYPSDSCVVVRGDGRFIEVMPPRYYDRLLEKVDPSLFAKVKASRAEAREVPTIDSTKESVYYDYLKGEVLKETVKNCLIRS